MSDLPYIKSSRQMRALENLLVKGSYTVSEASKIIGAANPRQSIMELRRQGFGELIKTRRFPVKDRDGKDCYPGEYYLPPEYRPLVERVLKDYQNRSSTTGEGNTEFDDHSNAGV